MEKLPGALKPGGRVAILTFHSGEDKLVKRALKEGCRDGIYADYSKDVVLGRRMRAERQSPFHENALGDPGGRITD